ncbi:MAG: hypothetical protein HFJ35_03825 [Clostridia bacterium]|nr:hypothetical protein [Clostridia bacterium]
MNNNKDTKEKICAFYASDYHFEMMSLPYIDEKMKNKDEVIILTENNLEETMKTFLSKVNFKEEKKEKILKLDWKNNDFEKFKTIKEKIKEEKDLIIFIKGKEDYIQKVNQDIEKWIVEENHIKLINCYPLEEVGENLERIMSQYKKVLRTTGEKEIEKI